MAYRILDGVTIDWEVVEQVEIEVAAHGGKALGVVDRVDELCREDY